ncbi:unnamed protein product [Diatraea saccharalis]|uniref:Uncharacterized protein n=1 Tax=Diatraea saccharalis TaxID=40085 RepID=A0A9N9N4T9_9NEOP|nr:unnamed protein product [Diatraea saccharalis]
MGGDGGARRIRCRRRLRMGTLALGALLTMHCRVTASAVTGGFCIGIAICINAIIRAITCCTMASMSAVYVLHSVSDARLPFTYCSVEVVHLQPDLSVKNSNVVLILSLIVSWLILWGVMISEKISHDRITGDALEVAMYIHAASIGTEIIHGKGLNHYGIVFLSFTFFFIVMWLL